MSPVLPLLAATGVAFAMTALSLGLNVTTAPLAANDLALVVSAPWGPDAHDIIHASGLQETYPLRAPLGSFTQLADASDVSLLKEQGAWFVLDGERIAALCQ